MRVEAARSEPGGGTAGEAGVWIPREGCDEGTRMGVERAEGGSDEGGSDEDGSDEGGSDEGGNALSTTTGAP